MTTTAPGAETAHPEVRRSLGAPLLQDGDLPSPRHFIDGASREGSSGLAIDVVNPSTGEVFAQVPQGTAEDVDLAVASALAARREWAATTPRARSEILHRIADRIEEHLELLVRLEATNCGKPMAVAQDDIGSCVDTFRFMAGAVRAQTSMAAATYAEGHLSVILREPVGVVGVVTPWNYPLLMAAWKLAPILAAGNTVVLKPSEQTPLSTCRFAELVADLLPPGVLNIVTGYGLEVGARLSAHPDIDLVALTGSVNSGKAVALSAAESLKRVHLELGGKAPVLVFEDADLDAVAVSLRAAGFWNSGQECGAACRVLAHESVADRLVAKLVEQVAGLVVGDPAAGDEVEIGPMVSQAHFERVSGFLERARAAGISAAVGGGPIPGPGFFIAPTVLAGVPDGAECSREEIFGPVITVESFTREDEAVDRANEVPYGLAASVFTENARRALDVPSRLDFGTVWVNSHLVLATEVPWGGFKGSGYGRDLSIYALDDYSRTKHVMHNRDRAAQAPTTGAHDVDD